MLSSITPLGERGRANRWWLTVTAYITASAVGGAGVGSVLGGFGEVLLRSLPGDLVSTRLRLMVLVGLSAAGLAADLGVAGARIPSIRRQVDEQWIGRYRGWVYGAGYGFQLGAGFATIVTSAATWVALATMILTGAWSGGLVLGVVFGTVRALPVLLTAPVRSPLALRNLHLRNQRWATTAGRIGIAGQALVLGAASLLAITVTT